MELRTWRTRCAAYSVKLYRRLTGVLSGLGRIRTHMPLAGRSSVLLGLLVAGWVHTATYVYDASGRLRAVTHASSATGRYVNDALGNLVRIDQLAAGQLAIFASLPDLGAPSTPVIITGQGFSPTATAIPSNSTAQTRRAEIRHSRQGQISQF